MKRCGILIYALSTATALGLAACGGGGGGGGRAAAVQPFTNAIALNGSGGAAATTVSAATDINDGTPVPAGAPVGTTVRVEAVGMADDATNPGILQPMVWDFAPGAAATNAAGGIGTDVDAEDLPGLPGGEFGGAFGINNAGVIVGQSENGAAGPVEAVFWAAAAVPGGPRVAAQPLLPAGTAGAAFDINNNTPNGRIVGERVVDAVAGTTRAVFWANTTTAAVDLPVAVGATSSSAASISETNIIVGEVTDLTGTHAAVWKPDPPVVGAPAGAAPVFTANPILLAGVNPAAVPAPAIPTLTGDSTAVAIFGDSVLGEITDTATGEVHAVVWPGTVGANAAAPAVPTRPIDLGANTAAAGFSGAGLALGSSGGNSSFLIAGAPVRLHRDTATVESPTAGGSVNALSATGKAVGTGNGKAFLATP